MVNGTERLPAWNTTSGVRSTPAWPADKRKTIEMKKKMIIIKNFLFVINELFMGKYYNKFIKFDYVYAVLQSKYIASLYF